MLISHQFDPISSHNVITTPGSAIPFLARLSNTPSLHVCRYRNEKRPHLEKKYSPEQKKETSFPRLTMSSSAAPQTPPLRDPDLSLPDPPSVTVPVPDAITATAEPADDQPSLAFTPEEEAVRAPSKNTKTQTILVPHCITVIISTCTKRTSKSLSPMPCASPLQPCYLSPLTPLTSFVSRLRFRFRFLPLHYLHDGPQISFCCPFTTNRRPGKIVTPV